MFGLFESKKSTVRRRLEKLLVVNRTWFEWTMENDQYRPTLVVETTYELDPAKPDFYKDGLDNIRKIVAAERAEGQPEPLQVRVVPRMYD